MGRGADLTYDRSSADPGGSAPSVCAVRAALVGRCRPRSPTSHVLPTDVLIRTVGVVFVTALPWPWRQRSLEVGLGYPLWWSSVTDRDLLRTSLDASWRAPPYGSFGRAGSLSRALDVLIRGAGPRARLYRGRTTESATDPNLVQVTGSSVVSTHPPVEIPPRASGTAFLMVSTRWPSWSRQKALDPCTSMLFSSRNRSAWAGMMSVGR